MTFLDAEHIACCYNLAAAAAAVDDAVVGVIATAAVVKIHLCFHNKQGKVVPDCRGLLMQLQPQLALILWHPHSDLDASDSMHYLPSSFPSETRTSFGGNLRKSEQPVKL